MSLRIARTIKPTSGEEGIEQPGDDWSSRIVKLIPAEALGLYGTAIGLIASLSDVERLIGIWLVSAVCLLLIIIVRIRATRDRATGRGPQIKAIAVSLVSFTLWLAALAATGVSISPFAGLPYLGITPLLALLWGTTVPYFYRGD
jgi:hypothetical protein